MISPERIAEITALAEAATPGELCVVEDEIWDVRHDGEPGVPLFRPNRDYRRWGRDVSKDEIAANAAFIAAARTAVPELLAEREAMVARGAELEGAVVAVVDAIRDYLPPDGIDAQECLNRIIGAIDNPIINHIIAEIENGPA